MNKKRKLMKSPDSFDQFIMYFGIEEANSVEELMEKTLGPRSKFVESEREIYDFLTEVLSQNYTEEELTSIWNEPGPNLVFGHVGRPRPVKESIIWILMTTLRDICSERLGLQEKKPRHSFVTHKGPIGGL